MSFKISKCATCKKYILLDEAPWTTCDVYPECIPNEFFQNTTDSEKPIACKDYEPNPNWQKGDK